MLFNNLEELFATLATHGKQAVIEEAIRQAMVHILGQEDLDGENLP